MNLWTLKFAGTEALPLLQRGSGAGDAGGNLSNLMTMGVYGNTGAEGIKDPIDVASDFPWTNSPKTSKYDIPKIQLIESRIVLNSTVTNMVYSALASADSIKSAGVTVADAVTDLGSFFNKFNAPKPPPATSTDDANTANQNQEDGEESSLKTKITDLYNSALEAGNFKVFANPALKPYQGLYATELTGFNYYFPYLEDQYAQITTNFGEGDSNVITPIADLVKGVSEGLAGMANVLRPGTYIEKAKQFTMGDVGRQLNFKIPLLNTRRAEDISRNWQLIFGLIYQNRPGRVSKSIIDQPVIYEVNLPGVAYMPYAYISNLQVRFLGARRTMKFQVPVLDENDSNVGLIETTVPDAYELDITVTGMNEETRNFLYANVTKSKLQVNKAVIAPNIPTPATQPRLFS